MVFYRKYRPQTLDELIGQHVVKQTLKATTAAGKLSHAYLFCGPKGTGKTSTARILAKIVNCEDPQHPPCNKCTTCLAITNGSHLDVIEIDAASNRGIDDVRALRENIKLSPTTARKKVYIIDEVHMLSADAFNALLKTLEEPPDHVLFILATTEVAKIPQTILSRVTRLDFKLATIEGLMEDLKNIVKAEKIKIDDGALLAIAKRAQGSFRDGEKLLELLSQFGTINQKVIDENFSGGVFDHVCKLLENIAQHNTSQALEILNNETQTGAHIKELNLSILEILRQLLFIKHNLGLQLVRGEVGEDRFEELEKLASEFNLEHLIAAIHSFEESLGQIRFISIPTLPLEMAVVESCRVGISENSDKSRPEDSQSLAGENQKIRKSDTSEGLVDREVSESADIPIHRKTDTPGPSESLRTDSPDIQKIKDKWVYILETVRAYNFSLEALLRSAKILSCHGRSIVFEVPYSFHQRILEAPKSKDLLESILAEILGRSVSVATMVGQKPMRDEEIVNVEVAADDEIIRLASEIFNSDTVN